jgi:hypothetical protein
MVLNSDKGTGLQWNLKHDGGGGGDDDDGDS